MSRRIQRVCVIGAGLAGLACAVAAASCGMHVHVYDEQEHRTKCSGHVDVVPSMLRDLVALGIGDPCVRAGFPYHGVDLLDRRGRMLDQLPTENLSGPRYPAALGIQQSELHKILEDAAIKHGASLERGTRVESVHTHGDVNSLKLASGEQRLADLVVLATGSADMLRSQLFPHAHAVENLEQICWYALIPRPVDLDRPLLALGDFGQRVLLMPTRNDAACISLITPPSPSTTTVAHVHVRESLRLFAARVRALARYVSAETPVTMCPVQSGLLAVPWHRGAALAVGDCAHVLPSHSGQAAAQAIEDARVLSALLPVASDSASLLDEFQRRRVQRVQQVHSLSSRIARIDFAPERDTDLSQLMRQLSKAVEVPA